MIIVETEEKTRFNALHVSMTLAEIEKKVRISEAYATCPTPRGSPIAKSASPRGGAAPIARLHLVDELAVEVTLPENVAEALLESDVTRVHTGKVAAAATKPKSPTATILKPVGQQAGCKGACQHRVNFAEGS